MADAGGAGRDLGPWPRRMVNPVRSYDWGSTTALARLQRRPPSGGPEAELWMGAHPSAPSALVGEDGTHLSLDEVVSGTPHVLLGDAVHGRFGPRLPFLLKVLAIAHPLSLQVHPDAERARAAHAGEVEVLDGHRYVDPYPKPEMLYALERVDALCGFRSAARAAELLTLVDGDLTPRIAAPLLACDGAAGSPSETQCLEEALRVLVTWPGEDRRALTADVGRAARRVLAQEARSAAPLSGDDRVALMWTARLARLFPDDPLVAAPLLLDLVRLVPGETLFVPAGAPHAYLHGLGVEIMGSSDNVLRAGLTSKPVAVRELLHVVDGDSRPARDVPEHRVSPHEVVWRPGAEEFQLSRVRLAGPAPVQAHPFVDGPQVVLCTSGRVLVRCSGGPLELGPGESAFVGAGSGPLVLAGHGEVFRAAAGPVPAGP